VNHHLPQVCRHCHQLKLPELGRFVKVPGRHRGEAFVCLACLARRTSAMTRGRDQRTSPDAREARQVLLATGTPFTQEYQLGPYWFDFAVPSLRLLVEVDGRTYHRHPSRRARDRVKQELAEANGWRVARVSRPDVAGKVRAAYDLRECEVSHPDLPTSH
jgi:very-short-patch-repair endonuclease